MSEFTHLHVHSHYSLLNAVPKIKPLVQRAKALGMKKLALTDNGTLYGAVEFYQTCLKEGIQPILGVDAYVAPRKLTDMERGVDDRRIRLVLLAENNTGYVNLIKLVTQSHLLGLFEKPRIDLEVLHKHKEGLIGIIPSLSGEHIPALRGNDIERAISIVKKYEEVLGRNNIFMEITHHPEIEGHEYLQDRIRHVSTLSDIPLIAAHNVYYLDPEDRVAREVLIRIANGSSTDGEEFYEDEDFSLLQQDELVKRFKDDPQAIQNTQDVADRCSVDIPLGKWYFPDFAIASGRTADDELYHLAHTGLPWRKLEYTGQVKERLDMELKVINDKGYAAYFLVVADILREARSRGILTTIRGSVAGSLVTYLAGITNVNPLTLNLPFERFLNPYRPSAPDIDMDFADNRRDEMIEYTKQKYGRDNVAQIGTFGTMMARAAVRDVARALGYPYGVGDKIAKVIPFGSQGFPMTIDHALKVEEDFSSLYEKDKDTKRIVDLAKKIEGNARHVGVHAAGVVIAPKDLTEFVPLQFDPKGGGKLITQYDMHSVGEDGVGLLKFDFLGIKNLSILADAIRLVEKRHTIRIDIEDIPLDDATTFAMLAKGATGGVFQLNGEAMTRYLKDLKPTKIEDINAMIALYRPGPMKNIPEYIARKHGRAPIRYFHPKVRDFLEPSYGILVYQDDLLFTALTLAGYDWESVDKFRKAVGKKIPEEMARQHVKFVDGCIEHSGMNKQDAEAIWNLFEPFQGYGFNKAHAASYGKVAYQTAYMKANYPVEYMSSILTADSGDVEKVAEAVTECLRIGIRVLRPDVNQSFSTFTVVSKDGKDAIRFGLKSIKNFGEGIAEAIIAEREARGQFVSLSDFLTRVTNHNLNKRALEALIKCGALDSFEYKRGRMLTHIDELLTFSKDQRSVTSQTSLFGGMGHGELTLPEAKEAPLSDMLSWEREYLGLYVSGHPLDAHKESLNKIQLTIPELVLKPLGTQQVIGGIISDLRLLNTKRGDKMALLKISDYDGSITAVLFPDVFKEYRDFLISGTCRMFQGRVNVRNGDRNLVVERVKNLS